MSKVYITYKHIVHVVKEVEGDTQRAIDDMFITGLALKTEKGMTFVPPGDIVSIFTLDSENEEEEIEELPDILPEGLPN